MNLFRIRFIILFLFISSISNGQNSYVLSLKSSDWKINTKFYMFSEITDDRIDKSNAGKIHSDGKTMIAVFQSSLETDLKKLIDASIIQDTSSIPISISFEQFSVQESGSSKNHKITFEFFVKFYRTISGKKYKLYEAKGKPELVLQGTYPKAPETLIRESLKNICKSFDDWINHNKDIPPLAKKVVVIFEDDSGKQNKDTITWNKNNKLQWKDFMGTPASTGFMALSNCIFTYRALPKQVNGNLELHIHLNACFDRNHSWVKTNQKRDTLLAHEQLHFDICELNIRLLRNKISTAVLDPMEFDVQIDNLFNEVWKSYQEQQQSYDTETGHGIYADKQKSWEEKIRNDLNKSSSGN